MIIVTEIYFNDNHDKYNVEKCELIYTYDSVDEFVSNYYNIKIPEFNKRHELNNVGWCYISGSETNGQYKTKYAIDNTFKGTKDKMYLQIERDILPIKTILRNRVLNNVLDK